jgi:hypothetical protein
VSRSGYSDDGDNIGLWRGAVIRAIHGKRGQAFLRELAAAMDAMPVKKLITEELVRDGCFCTLGVVGAARGMDMTKIDYECPYRVGEAFGISMAMAAEIEYLNDEYGEYLFPYNESESDEARWTRMRNWVSENIREEQPA